MKILDRDEDILVKFVTIPQGHIFRVNNEIYLKIGEFNYIDEDEDESVWVNAVNLRDGTLTGVFDVTLCVDLPDAKIILR